MMAKSLKNGKNYENNSMEFLTCFVALFSC